MLHFVMRCTKREALEAEKVISFRLLFQGNQNMEITKTLMCGVTFLFHPKDFYDLYIRSLMVLIQAMCK